jgi:sensor domain CHASE-containing protein
MVNTTVHFTEQPTLAQPQFRPFMKAWLEHMAGLRQQAKAAKLGKRATKPRPPNQAYLDIKKKRG